MVPPKQSRIPRHDARAARRNRPRPHTAVDAVVRRPYIHTPSRLRKLFLLRLVEKKMNYTPKPGLNVPVITVLDDSGRVIADEQRQVIRHVIQNGYGADVVFGAGTTGEWNRIANAERQRIMEIEVDEVRRINAVRIADCGLRIADSQIADYGLRDANSRRNPQ